MNEMPLFFAVALTIMLTGAGLALMALAAIFVREHLKQYPLRKRASE